MTYLVLSGNVISCQHADNAGKGFCLLRMNGLYNGSGIFGAYSASVDHFRKIHLIQIIYIFSCSQYLSLSIDPVNPASHPDHLLLLRRSDILPQHLSCQLDRIYNLFISGTPAVVIADRIGNLHTAGIGIYIQKPFGADHHSRNTETALNRSRFSKGIYIHILFSLA